MRPSDTDIQVDHGRRRNAALHCLYGRPPLLAWSFSSSRKRELKSRARGTLTTSGSCSLYKPGWPSTSITSIRAKTISSPSSWSSTTMILDQLVETLNLVAAETYQRWDKREEGDRLVFRAPDGYIGGEVGWCYDHTRQKGVAAPVDVLDREQLRNRKSLIVNGFKKA